VCKQLQQQIDNMATNTDNSTVNKSKSAIHCCILIFIKTFTVDFERMKEEKGQ
jgi:hypothetical protein